MMKTVSGLSHWDGYHLPDCFQLTSGGKRRLTAIQAVQGSPTLWRIGAGQIVPDDVEISSSFDSTTTAYVPTVKENLGCRSNIPSSNEAEVQTTYSVIRSDGRSRIPAQFALMHVLYSNHIAAAGAH
jgi:hypothetical protein